MRRALVGEDIIPQLPLQLGHGDAEGPFEGFAAPAPADLLGYVVEEGSPIASFFTMHQVMDQDPRGIVAQKDVVGVEPFLSPRADELGELLLEHLQAEGSTTTYRRTVLMNRDSSQTPDRADAATDEGPFAEDEAIEWEDLIPEAPARPSGRIPVRLRKAGRDKPLPAENPWAE